MFTTRPPAVTDVFDSGRNEEPYARHVVYISGHWHRDWQTTFRGAPIIVVTPIALELLKLGPNSKRGK